MAVACRDLNIPLCQTRGSHIKDNRCIAGSGPGKGNRVRAEKGLLCPCRCNRWLKGGTGKACQPLLCQIFCFRPHRGKMKGIDNTHDSNACFRRSIGQYREACFQCQRGITIIAIHADDRGQALFNFWHSIALYFARGKRGNISRHTKQPVRGRAITFSTGHSSGQSGCIISRTAMFGKNAQGQIFNICKAYFPCFNLAHDICLLFFMMAVFGQ